MEPKVLRERLVDLLNKEYAAQQDFLNGLTDAERAEAGTPDRWAPKDLLAHIAGWQDKQTQTLAAALEGKTPPGFGDVEELNAADFETFHTMPWNGVVAFAEKALSTLIAQTQTIAEDTLTMTLPSGRPLWGGIVGNGYSHPQTHLAEYYVRQGQLHVATRMQEAVADALSQLDKPYGRGVALYNLACFYAVNGQSGKALTLLPEALKLAPDLVEWSKEDSDLLPLHSEPAYQALYTR